MAANPSSGADSPSVPAPMQLLAAAQAAAIQPFFPRLGGTNPSSLNRRIAIAVDLSDESVFAVKWAVQNYLRPRDEIILLHVRPAPVLYGADRGSIPAPVAAAAQGGASEEELKKKREDYDAFTSIKAEDLPQPLVDAQMPFKIRVVNDHDIKERLCLEAKRLGLSTMIIGSRGSGDHGEGGKGMLGSVSDYCVHHCVCSVVVLRNFSDATGAELRTIPVYHSATETEMQKALCSRTLCNRAKRSDMEFKECTIDPALLPALEGLLQEINTSLQPKPVDYENRHTMINAFNIIAKRCFGKSNGFPIVEAFGSFTMDLFTPTSDLDLSVNFGTTKDLYDRNDKIDAIKKLAKVLNSQKKKGRCHGILAITSAIVPVLKVTDEGTGIECDISIENKDGVSRSMMIKFVSSIDERFRTLCYLMKFWAKAHNVNSPKDKTMSSMTIISLVAFHLQTRRPPILPAFSAILKDGSDFSSIEKSVSVFKGFGSSNKESIAELFVSLMTKLASVEDLWEQGLCASSFEGSWVPKIWQRGVGNLSVEDFLDQSQNFARSVGMMQMRNICGCLRATVSDLSKFFMGKIAPPELKALLFEPLNQVEPLSNPSQKTVKRKCVNENTIKGNAKKKSLEAD